MDGQPLAIGFRDLPRATRHRVGCVSRWCRPSQNASAVLCLGSLGRASALMAKFEAFHSFMS